MGASTPAEPVTGVPARVAAVEAARERLGTNLDRFDAEVRAQVSQTMEKTTWKLFGTLTAIAAGVLTRKVLVSVWERAAHRDPPANPAAPGTTWGEGIVWALATGAGIGVGRMVAARGAAAGWRKVTGALPPGLEDVA